MTVHKNSAQMLRTLIQSFCQVSTNKGGGIPALHTWMTVLDATEGNTWEKLTQLRNLIDDIEKSIKKNPTKLFNTRYLNCLEQIRSSLNPIELTSSASTYEQKLFAPNGSVMTTLDFCVDALSVASPEIEIPSETFIALTAEGQELLQLVLDTIEDPKLRALLAELIHGFNFSLEAYRIRGIASIEESLDIILGKLTRQSQALKQASYSEKSIIKKLFGWIRTGAEVTKNAREIAETGLLSYETVIDQIGNNL